MPKQDWPPTIENLTSESRKTPASVTLFLTLLLSSRKHKVIDSYSVDFVHGIDRGKVITAKHSLLALGLHNITGQKQTVVISNKLGHCISYDLTCKIETAQAEAALVSSKESNILPLKPV